MQPSIIVAPPHVILPAPQPSNGSGQEIADLIRQLIDVQKDQLAMQKTQAAAQDNLARWRSFLGRWQNDFPDIGLSCRQVMPIIERAYLTMIRELTERLTSDEPDCLDNEFALNEFLDRYGMRLGQLGTVLSQLGPLADAAPPPTPAADTPPSSS